MQEAVKTGQHPFRHGGKKRSVKRELGKHKRKLRPFRARMNPRHTHKPRSTRRTDVLFSRRLQLVLSQLSGTVLWELSRFSVRRMSIVAFQEIACALESYYLTHVWPSCSVQKITFQKRYRKLYV